MIVLFEVFVLLILLFFLMGSRIVKIMSKKKIGEENHLISNALINCIVGSTNLETTIELLKNRSVNTLLNQLEMFNHRFIGNDWVFIKKGIAKIILLKSARKMVSSSNWLKRSFAARSFALVPLFEDKSSMISLISDPDFNVRSFAIEAVLSLGTKDGIYKIIQQMSLSGRYEYCFYCDLLAQHCTIRDFKIIQAIAAQPTNDKMHLACLDVLAATTMPLSYTNLWKDLESKNKDIRLKAIQIFANYPQKNGLIYLQKFLNDLNEKMRLEAVKGLRHYPSDEVFVELNRSLDDSSWNVRFQAARVLKELGPKGITILQKKHHDGSKRGQDVAGYVLNFY
jgi:hypothetical protein